MKDPCSHCKLKAAKAKGLCAACYYWQNERGEPRPMRLIERERERFEDTPMDERIAAAQARARSYQRMERMAA